MTTLTCTIPEKLDARLEELAKAAKLPKGKFVRKTLEQAARQPLRFRTRRQSLRFAERPV